MNKMRSLRIAIFTILIMVMIFGGIFLFFFYNSGKNITNYQKMLGRATDEYNYYREDNGIINCNFYGPQIQDYKLDINGDTNYLKFSWYYCMDKDTFWIYCETHIKEVKSDGIYLSPNIGILADSCRKWN